MIFLKNNNNNNFHVFIEFCYILGIDMEIAGIMVEGFYIIS
jgi:hypothetical protein